MTDQSVRPIRPDDVICPCCQQPSLQERGHSGYQRNGKSFVTWWKGFCPGCRAHVERHLIGHLESPTTGDHFISTEEIETAVAR